MTQPILIGGEWRPADAVSNFQPLNPQTKEPTGEIYPVSSVSDVDQAVKIGAEASEQLLPVSANKIAQFLELYADRIEARRDEIVEMAHLETAYPKETRLDGIELPRPTNQLRQAAESVRDRSWTQPVIDTKANTDQFTPP